MALNRKVESYMKSACLYATITMYWLGTETNIFGNKLKAASDFLKNENAIFIGTLISRINHTAMINSHGVSI